MMQDQRGVERSCIHNGCHSRDVPLEEGWIYQSLFSFPFFFSRKNYEKLNFL